MQGFQPFQSLSLRFSGLVFCGMLTALPSWLTSAGYGQNDFLITAPNSDSVERYDAATGEHLGSFISAGSGGLDRPGSVAVGPDGNVYVTSSAGNQVLRYDGQSGAFMDVFAEGNGLVAPNNLLFQGDHLYVGQFAGGSNGFVKRYDAITGDFVDNFLDVDFVDGFAFVEDTILVSNFAAGVNQYRLSDGSLIGELISAGDGGLINPTAILPWGNGELLVSSYGDDTVKRFDANGNYLGDAITGLATPEGLAIGPDGKLYAGSYGEGLVNRYDADTFAFDGEFIDHGPVTNFFIFRTTAVPEPSAGILLVIGAVGLFAKRRRACAGVQPGFRQASLGD